MGGRDRANSYPAPGDIARVDGAEFADLVRPHVLAMTRLALRLGPSAAADDVVQEALVRAWRHRSRYDPTRGAFATWLLTIVANEARRAGNGRSLPLRIDPAGGGPSLDDRIDIEKAVATLPARQKLAVDCFYFAGLSVSQTAAVMSASEGTVKSTLADARANLRKLLEKPA